MKIQILIPRYNIPVSYYMPFGAMYIARSLMDEGHIVRIDDCHMEKISEKEIYKIISEFSPDVIGYSAIVATSYKFVKETSRKIKELFPNTKIIIGGGLTAATDIVLKNTDVDVAVIGEGDLTVKELIKSIEQKTDFSNIKGIAYKENNNIIYTPPRSLIQNLDVLNYPAFELIDVGKYTLNVVDFLKRFKIYTNWDKRFFSPHRQTQILRIPTGRGCIASCAFCYRHMRGLRHFSFDYLFRYIEYLMDKFKTNQFSFGDECFSSNKKWVWEFIEEIKKRKLDIMFQILGMRVDTVDREILYALKEIGCWMIEYGFESGSQKILNIMGKNITVQDNINVALWTKEADIFTSPAFVLGMPGETTETVYETIEFIKKIKYNQFQYTFALPMPGTPLYDYAKLNGYIVDEDKYLESIYFIDLNNFVETKEFINFTEEDIATVRKWSKMMIKEVMKSNSSLCTYYFNKSKLFLAAMKREGMLKYLYKYIRRKLRTVILPLFKSKSFGRQSMLNNKSSNYKEDMIPREGENLKKINIKIKEILLKGSN